MLTACCSNFFYPLILFNLSIKQMAKGKKGKKSHKAVQDESVVRRKMNVQVKTVEKDAEDDKSPNGAGTSSGSNKDATKYVLFTNMDHSPVYCTTEDDMNRRTKILERMGDVMYQTTKSRDDAYIEQKWKAFQDSLKKVQEEDCDSDDSLSLHLDANAQDSAAAKVNLKGSNGHDDSNSGGDAGLVFDNDSSTDNAGEETEVLDSGNHLEVAGGKDTGNR